MNKNINLSSRTIRSMVSLITGILMIAALLPATSAFVPIGSLQTEQPVLVITGQDLPSGARGSADNVTNEKAYTLDELRALEALVAERLYSSINRYGTKGFYRAQGVDLEGILALSGYTDKGRVASLASDGYRSVVDLNEERNFYPNHVENDDSGAEAAKPMLAWKNVESSETPAVHPEPFETMNEEADGHSLRVFVGQLSVEDVNNNFFTRNVNTLVAGDAIEGADLTVCGVEFSRADILLMPRAVHTYTYSTSGGERSDTLRGVPLAVLLEDVDNDAEISFASVDNWGGISAFTMTKTELVAKNAMLTYEIKGDDGWAGYCRATDDGFGYFRLMVDGMNGAHAVNTVIANASGGSGEAGEPDSWAAEEVAAALEAGLVPDSIAKAGWKDPASRLAAAEAMVLLIEKASGKAMEELAAENEWDLSTGGFSDTDSPEVTFLKHAGVTNGMGDGTFAPESTFTRAHAVTMIGRAAEFFFDIEAKGDNPFNDVIPDWAVVYVGYAAENDITKGEDAELGLFGAGNLLQNQTAVMFILRAYNVWK